MYMRTKIKEKRINRPFPGLANTKWPWSLYPVAIPNALPIRVARAKWQPIRRDRAKTRYAKMVFTKPTIPKRTNLRNWNLALDIRLPVARIGITNFSYTGF